MEKWKIATIAALLLSLIGFGLYQQKAGEAPPIGTPSGTASSGGPVTASTPSAISQLYNGKSLPAWNFPKWVNTAKPVATSQLAGKTTFVEIFRTGCSHCQDAAPMMAAIDARYGPRGLKMIGIQSPGYFKDPQNPENDWADVQAWVKEKKLKYPIAFDPQSSYFQGTITKQFLKGDTSRLLYPMMIIVGPDGKIAFSQSGHNTSKAIELGVELEKRFPSSKDLQKNAEDLVKWLAPFLPDIQLDANLAKAMADDIAQRLK